LGRSRAGDAHDRQAAVDTCAVIDIKLIDSGIDPVLRSEDYFDAQTRNRGGGVLAQDIDRPHLMSINSDRIRQHSKPQMATMPRCNLFERRKVLLLQNINAGRNMSDSGYGKQQENRPTERRLIDSFPSRNARKMELRRTILDFEDLLYGNRHFSPVVPGINAPGAQVRLSGSMYTLSRVLKSFSSTFQGYQDQSAPPPTAGQCVLRPETPGSISYWRQCSAIILID